MLLNVQELCVSYLTKKTELKAVDHVSFGIERGDTLGIIGESGSGKTTIGTLVPRFYDVQEGRITLGGVELSEISRQEVMGKIAFVCQFS